MLISSAACEHEDALRAANIQRRSPRQGCKAKASGDQICRI